LLHRRLRRLGLALRRDHLRNRRAHAGLGEPRTNDTGLDLRVRLDHVSLGDGRGRSRARCRDCELTLRDCRSDVLWNRARKPGVVESIQTLERTSAGANAFDVQPFSSGRNRHQRRRNAIHATRTDEVVATVNSMASRRPRHGLRTAAPRSVDGVCLTVGVYSLARIDLAIDDSDDVDR
jgi:hypothetical protein